ncbi:MAG: 1-acyl-sn-glycerol-3-phosphate acyltransferase [Chitinophagia bacterium]|nr:1-acyl-sn-glycerol-3-phosphate acyltransferase [Chitinophagia bacterium]
MKRLLNRLFTVYVGLAFILTMSLVLLPIWIAGLWPEPRRTDIVIRLLRAWMAVFFPLAGVRLRIRGREHFEPGSNYIVVCNHNSLMDVPVTTPGIPGPNKTIAKVEMARIPLFGIIYRRGSVLVDRHSEKSRRDSYGAMRRVLEEGMHMCIYPEGTRNLTGKPLKSFHDGAFRLACETGKSIIPALIFGTSRMLPSQPPMGFHPGQLELHFLAPVDVRPGEDPVALKETVFQTMWAYYEAHATPT